MYLTGPLPMLIRITPLLIRKAALPAPNGKTVEGSLVSTVDSFEESPEGVAWTVADTTQAKAVTNNFSFIAITF
jgi:hypothetical protein